MWSFIVLLDSRSLKDSNGISFAIFGSTDKKIWFLQDWDQIWFQFLIRVSVLTRGWPRGLIWLDDTGSFGSGLWAVRSKEIRTSQICPYRLDKWSNLGHQISIQRARKEGRGTHQGLGFRREITGEAHWWLNSGEASVVQNYVGDVDDMRRRTVISFVWSS
jgi:hypothetical protein